MNLTLQNISFCYPNQKEKTINNISIELNLSMHTAIMGASGSGKSTLLRLIAGFEEPDSGSILLKDKILYDNKINVPTEKRNIGMVFQNYILFPHMTVEKNISYGIDNIKTLSKIAKKERIEEILELIDLQSFRHTYPHTLSGGQQQRVALGRAIAPRPALLLLDEPFSNLDAFLRNKIKKEMKDILDRAKIATVLVTHLISDLDIADHVILLDRGQKAKEGTLESLREDKNCPFVKHLLQKISD
ncbi:MAG: ABC transporter ATP-binding protein [Brevinema sp.]